MTLHLTLAKAVPVPASQLRIIWQGYRIGDTATAAWTDQAGPQVWRAEGNLSWLQRDSYVPGEEWKINLAGTPAGVDSITLLLTSSTPRTVGVAVLPLAGDPDDGMVHPGTELVADQQCQLLHLRSIGGQWHIIATNTTATATEAPAVGGGGSQSRPSGDVAAPGTVPPIDSGRQIPIPAHLQPAVDKIRAAGGAIRRPHVDAVVDISASMRPWLASGLVADALSAVLAVTGASSRPALSLRFSPGGAAADFPLDAVPADALTKVIGQRGLQTGNVTDLAAAVQTAAGRGGIVFVISDDASVVPPAAGSTVAVVLGGGPAATGRPDRQAVDVGPGTVDVPTLARELALAVRDMRAP